ncbi:MAG: adenylate cyclase [Chloroflexota bacterium]|jgi:adenylate cyclase|nr:adenylate cyclase [Chloroflexota bacterium]
MSDYSRQQAAERADVSVDQLTQILELGMLGERADDRFTSGDIRKIGLVRDLTAAGLPLDALAAELKTGHIALDFLDNPAFDMFSALTNQTFEELSASKGIPINLLLVIREAIGSALPSPTDRVGENELAVVPLIEGQLASGYSPAAIERGLRTMGDSLQRVTTADANDFRRFVIEAAAKQPGATGADIGAAGARGTQLIAAASDRALVAIYHAQQAHNWTAGIIEGWERDLARAGLYSAMERPPAVCFLDITGYTRLTAERGDEAAAELAHDLARLVQRTSVQYGGRAVKWLGDGVMFYFRDPGSGVMAALDMAAGVTAAGLPPAHVGLHAGPVVMQGGDYYGQTVNIASRIAGYARPGEVVVSQVVVNSAEASHLAFTDLGETELKGVAGTVHLYAARRA